MFLNNPEYAKVGEKKYKINTDFRVALRCQEVAMDTTIGDYERAEAIIYLLFGDEGLKNQEDQPKLLDIAVKYLSCGKELQDNRNEKQDMDLIQDFKFIEASFRSDYGITLSSEKMHWWDFYMYLNGLTDKCVLNRVREIRTMDLNDIKDAKEKNKIRKIQKQFELKQKETPLTEKQKESVEKFYKLTGLNREE